LQRFSQGENFLQKTENYPIGAI